MMNKGDAEKYPVNQAVDDEKAYCESVMRFLKWLGDNGYVIHASRYVALEYDPKGDVIAQLHGGGYVQKSEAEWIVESLDLDYDEYVQEKDDMLVEWRKQQDEEGGI